MIRYEQGDIFDTPADIRVNTVNCVGVMGAGVALAFKNRYPDMFRDYVHACKDGLVRPGKPHLWEKGDLYEPVTVVNLPTKDHWRQPSTYEYVEKGLMWLHDFVAQRGNVRVTVPALGCGHGGLDWEKVKPMMETSLCDLAAEIIIFGPSTSRAAGEKVNQEALDKLEDLGIARLRPGDPGYPQCLAGRSDATIYVKGDTQDLNQPIVAFLPSIKPENREKGAVLDCVQGIASPGVTVLFGYSAHADRPLIRAALEQGANVVICLVEGILEFKVRRDLQDVWDDLRVTIISAAQPTQRWFKGGVGKATSVKLAMSKAAVISDPYPSWLRSVLRHRVDIADLNLFCLDYGERDPSLDQLLKQASAKTLGRNRKTGKPKVAEILTIIGHERISDGSEIGREDAEGVHVGEKHATERLRINYPKRLIEVDLPIKRISAHARREKSIRHGHISTLHIWWARRPLAACRAVVCASLWPDPGDKICPPRFIEAAKRLMAYWGKECLAKCSTDSYTRFNKIAKTPDCLDDAAELRKALFDFIADFANWDNSTDSEYLAVARALTVAAHDALEGLNAFTLPDLLSVKTLNDVIKDAPRPLLVDPFAGGGAIPLEGLRCGTDVFASDLNPVAVLLNKIVLEYIPKYGQCLADEVEKWGKWIKKQAEKELAEFYPKDPDGATPIAYLWARTIVCEGPGCGAEVPLMRALWLAKKGDKSVAVQIVPKPEEKRCDFVIIKKQDGKWVYQDTPDETCESPMFDGTVARGSVTCPCCGFTTPIRSVRVQLKKRKGGANDAQMFAVVTTRSAQKGRFYRLPTDRDLSGVRKAAKELENRIREHNGELALVPDEPTEQYHAFVNRGPIYGMLTWGDFFTPRQALALTTLVRLVSEAGAEMAGRYGSEQTAAVQTFLALSLDKQADLGNSLNRWEPVAQCPRQLFARQAIPMVWDFAEGVVTGDSSGAWGIQIDRAAHVLRKIGTDWLIGHSEQVSATAHPLPDDSAQTLFTDPPYYYSMQYADLSDFFYVWLRRTLITVHPALFRSPLTEKSDEIIVQSPGHEHAMEGKNNAFYESRMKMAMAEGRRVLAPSGVGSVVFANTSTSGWEAMLQALVESGWVLTASWPIDTEMTTRVLAQNKSVLGSSIHLVCRPREDEDGDVIERVGDWRDVLSELPGRIADWLPRLASEGVVGADAIFACLGPALEIFSRYSSVEKASGEIVPLREYLEQVWAEVARQALNMIFEGADASGFEEDARLTAMWLWTLRTEVGNGNGEDDDKTTSLPGYTLEYDAARKIAQGLGCHLENLGHLVEVKGDKAMLLSAESRARYLFGKEDVRTATKRRKKKEEAVQQDLFSILGLPSDEEAETERAELERPPAGKTALDQLHQAMLLFTAGRSAALKRFLVDDGIGANPQFWTLAQAFSALYPPHTNEKRWVDGVLARKKGLGL